MFKNLWLPLVSAKARGRVGGTGEQRIRKKTLLRVVCACCFFTALPPKSETRSSAPHTACRGWRAYTEHHGRDPRPHSLAAGRDEAGASKASVQTMQCSDTSGYRGDRAGMTSCCKILQFLYHASIHIYIYAHACMHACMYVRMCVCSYVCMYVCLYVICM